jgi:hypothetical protein
MAKPIAPAASPTSTDPEDVQAWEDYYAACEEEIELSKPCMRDRD